MPGIIVGIDGSDHSLRALDWAVREAGIRRAPLTVLTVTQAVAGFWGSSPAVCPGDQELVEKAQIVAEEATERALDQVGADGRPASVAVQATIGLAAEALIEAGAGADLLVVGSRGEGGFKRLLMGSVSLQVTHHAPCPVVVIPDPEDPWPGRPAGLVRTKVHGSVAAEVTTLEADPSAARQAAGN